MDIDVNDLRSLVTVASFVLFLALAALTWSKRNKAAFDAAAQLPFAGDEPADSKNHGGQS